MGSWIGKSTQFRKMWLLDELALEFLSLQLSSDSFECCAASFA
jgi:hypothetical protein